MQLPLNRIQQGRNQIFRMRGRQWGRRGWADRDSKWWLSIDPCTKCHLMGGGGGRQGGRASDWGLQTFQNEGAAMGAQGGGADRDLKWQGGRASDWGLSLSPPALSSGYAPGIQHCRFIMFMQYQHLNRHIIGM